MDSKKVAVIQFAAKANVAENLKIVEKYLEVAADSQVCMVVLPEMFSIMGNTMADKIAVAENLGKGIVQDFLAEQAKKHRFWIIGGTIPLKSRDNNRVYATTLVYNEKGKVVARYDKIHLFDVALSEIEIYEESASTVAGNQIVVVDTPVGKVGLAVCYDLRFPELFRCLFLRGAEIIVIPSAFTMKTGSAHWEVLLRSRAIENLSYVIGAGQGGTHVNGRETYGHSMIVGPWGDIVAEIPGTEAGILMMDINLDVVHEARSCLPVASHQRIFFDESKLK